MDQLALELSGLPITVANLRVDHCDGGDGLCTGCTRPGFGTRYVPWPCRLRLLADEAAAILRALVELADTELADVASSSSAPGGPEGLDMVDVQPCPVLSAS